MKPERAQSRVKGPFAKSVSVCECVWVCVYMCVCEMFSSKGVQIHSGCIYMWKRKGKKTRSTSDGLLTVSSTLNILVGCKNCVRISVCSR